MPSSWLNRVHEVFSIADLFRGIFFVAAVGLAVAAAAHVSAAQTDALDARTTAYQSLTLLQTEISHHVPVQASALPGSSTVLPKEVQEAMTAWRTATEAWARGEDGYAQMDTALEEGFGRLGVKYDSNLAGLIQRVDEVIGIPAKAFWLAAGSGLSVVVAVFCDAARPPVARPSARGPF